MSCYKPQRLSTQVPPKIFCIPVSAYVCVHLKGSQDIPYICLKDQTVNLYTYFIGAKLFKVWIFKLHNSFVHSSLILL